MTGGKVAEAVCVDSLRSEARSARMLNSRGSDAMTACPCLADPMVEKSRVTTGLQTWLLPTWMPARSMRQEGDVSGLNGFWTNDAAEGRDSESTRTKSDNGRKR